jgi:hypothetical protein
MCNGKLSKPWTSYSPAMPRHNFFGKLGSKGAQVNQIIKKIKIVNVSEKEAMKAITTGMFKLGSAILEQLKASVIGLAETFDVVKFCPKNSNISCYKKAFKS